MRPRALDIRDMFLSSHSRSTYELAIAISCQWLEPSEPAEAGAVDIVEVPGVGSPYLPRMVVGNSSGSGSGLKLGEQRVDRDTEDHDSPRAEPTGRFRLRADAPECLPIYTPPAAATPVAPVRE